MPVIVRWFPVTHDINADPELWELREKYGDRAGFVWLECLSIADRNNGLIGPDTDQTRNQLAAKCRSSRVKVGLVLDWCRAKGWLISDNGLRVAKWLKYHRTREPNKIPSEPNLTKPKQTKTSSPENGDLTVKDLVDSWNEQFAGKLASVQWPLSPSRHRKASLRIKEHQNLDFWNRVFTNIGQSKFLLGHNNGTWRCTLDFLIANDTNLIKIYEGVYNGTN